MLYKYIITALILQQTLQKYILSEKGGYSTQTKFMFNLTYVQEQGFKQIYKEEQIAKDLLLQVRFENQNQVDVRIIDQARKHYQIPDDIEPFKSTYNDINEPIWIQNQSQDLSIKLETQSDPFFLKIVRVATNEAILFLNELEFSKLYISFKNQACSNFFFGMGERNQVGLRFREGIYTLMARDEPKIIEDGKKPGKHVYSSQPVYLMREQSGNYHVFFYKTASPMDFEYHNNEMKFITIGGVIHIKLFLGDQSPNNAVKLYHEYLGGGWALHPFWSSGFHQSRWGYKNSQKLIDVINEYQKYEIPLDVIWSDLDYMFDRQIFTVDTAKFTPDDYDSIQNKLGVKYVPLIDVAVGVKYQNDVAYKKGIEMDIFHRSPATGQRFKGYVWPGNAYFPDWNHPNMTTYWPDMVSNFYEKVKFDGLWIDMNEPANFCDGECSWNNNDRDTKLDYINRKINFPYLPGGQNLATKTLDPHLLDFNKNTHIDTHNLYGFMESWHSNRAQKQIGKILPFSLSRSTFPGSGKYTQHWFGDNAATWDMMYLSVGQIFQFNVFGIPLSGADVCGFMDNTEEHLCSRWVQLGALYPFFRNHNNDLSMDQEFYNLGSTVLKSAQKNVKLRYSILKWYYSLFVRSKQLGAIFKPLFFEFSDDLETLKDTVLDTQIILGKELMAAPILTQDTVIRSVYFPQGTWYEFISGLMIQDSLATNRDHLIFCPYDDFVPLFIRGGSIILVSPTQNVKTTRDLSNQYTVLIALDSENKQDINGQFLDINDFLNENEVQEKCLKSNCLLDLNVQYNENEMILKIHRNDSQDSPQNEIYIKQIIIYGFSSSKDIKCFDGQEMLQNCEIKSRSYNYNSKILFKNPFQVGGGYAKKSQIIRLQFLN